MWVCERRIEDVHKNWSLCDVKLSQNTTLHELEMYSHRETMEYHSNDGSNRAAAKRLITILCHTP